MKKLCLLVFGLVLLLPTVGHASFLRNDAYECAVDNDGTDWFWYCGEQSRSCRGISQGDGDHYVILTGADDYTKAPPSCDGDPKPCPNYDRKAVHHEGEAFVCCGGTGNYSGKLLSYNPNKWLETKTEELADVGMITYYKNGCGTTFHDERKADGSVAKVKGKYPSCPVGQTVRTFKIYVNNDLTDVLGCVTPCPSGQGFESTNSDVCIDCPVTKTQGIDNYNTCVKCASNEFFRTGTDCTGSDCCVKKSDVPAVSQQALSWCWRCPMGNKSIWRSCISGGLLQECGQTQPIPNDLKVKLEDVD